MSFFVVEIQENVGEMVFPNRTICCAPSFAVLEQHLDKKMSNWRGKGDYDEETEVWKYGNTSAFLSEIREITYEAAKSAFQNRLIPLWLWVNN
ncbi:hypothetical protein ACP179_01875 (plasmid) [Xenorhabdus stockiae]|uniref:hypothetical protein n=1 Tax=Xenorhabdus stockiae TaxID=351614 RepID=UPI003CF4B4C8